MGKITQVLCHVVSNSENSGINNYLNVIPTNTSKMAERGFWMISRYGQFFWFIIFAICNAY